MRNKLLLSAAVAAAMSFSAMADTAPIVKPAPPDFEVDVDKPVLPTHPNPVPAIFDKDAPDINALFEPTDNRFRQQARVDQTGEDNVATTDQTGGQEGLAHIRQTGDDNNASITQSDNGDNLPLPNPPTDFTVPTNVAIVGQTGGGNTGDIDQLNTLTNGPANLADVHQFSDDDAPADTNTVDIDQLDGRALTARGNQGAEDARANNNSATIAQTGQGDTTVSVAAFIDQQSDGNTASVVQFDVDEVSTVIVQEGSVGFAGSAANIADVTQTGGESDLTVELFQSNTGAGFASDGDTANDATILQTGRGNSIVSSQVNDDNLLNLTQSGEYNDIQTEQTDDVGFTSNDIVATQSGDNNDLYVRQLNAPSEANITQDGSFGEINIEQIASGANVVDGFTNTLSVGQSGTGNIINVLQQDDNNNADIDQDGLDNKINLEQTDNTDNGSNFATLTQTAAVSNSSIHVVQDDAENTAAVNQTAGDNLTVSIQQSGDAVTNFGFGDANAATVTQEGTDNTIEISQEASNVPGLNFAPVNTILFDQSGVNNLTQISQVGEGNTVDAAQTGTDNILQIIVC